jgi:hypothetical protein
MTLGRASPGRIRGTYGLPNRSTHVEPRGRPVNVEIDVRVGD